MQLTNGHIVPTVNAGLVPAGTTGCVEKKFTPLGSKITNVIVEQLVCFNTPIEYLLVGYLKWYQTFFYFKVRM